MPRYQRNPNAEEIFDVAQLAIDIFRTHGLRSCLFGSAACRLFGVSRTPNDVDMVVFADYYDQEELKHILVNDNDNFYLVPSRNRSATYQVLWYRVSNRCKCKVDILLPGTLDIPEVPRHRVKRISGIPVMPLIPLLLLKLRGWYDHRESNRDDMQQKQYVDIGDIDELLEIAVERRQHVDQNNLSWLPQEMVSDGQDRVYDYVDENPSSASDWVQVGFNV